MLACLSWPCAQYYVASVLRQRLELANMNSNTNGDRSASRPSHAHAGMLHFGRGHSSAGGQSLMFSLVNESGEFVDPLSIPTSVVHRSAKVVRTMVAPTTASVPPSMVERSPLQSTRGGNNMRGTEPNNDTATAADGGTAASDFRATKTADLETTYTSLIQQYLQVMCLENATFLAERMVATCAKTTNSIYLLALCHYRSNRPQRAQSVLEECKRHNASTLYLLAKCCFDMEQYGRAEEALLQQARSDFRDFKASTASERGGADGMSSQPSMDEWIVETSPCPVPNGAAGLHLLADICRRSNRKQRAMQYYRLALKVSAGISHHRVVATDNRN